MAQPARIFLTLVAAAVLLILGGLVWRATAADLQRPSLDLSPIPYTGSRTCRSCHVEAYTTWQRTYHRTMTQWPTPTAVLGDFDNAVYTYRGVVSRFSRDGEQYFIETEGYDGTRMRYPVVMTIGSRRIQQYVTRIGDRHWRIPLAWDIGEQRWFHLNGGFLDPDDAPFNQHLALWDANCIFCHNTKALPNFDPATQMFAAEVEELGIACEACHGPAETHARVNANPLRRYALHLTDNAALRDPTLISPRELSAERQVQLCGRCHGQRLPNPLARIDALLADGDPFTAGEDLSTYYTPIWRDTQLPGSGVDFSLRFWQDGSPRLTAHEYQGWLLSGHQGTELTCTSCHAMHGGDPKGMIEEALRGDLGCAQCHSEVAADLSAHTGHAPESAGSRCYDCHMPQTTYGVLDIHPSHRIDNPDPSRAWRYAMPEACTLCHTNQTAVWAADWVEARYGLTSAERPSDPAFAVAENVRALLAGDVIQRSVAALAFAEVGTYTPDPRGRLWATPFLLYSMEHDEYAAIRQFAWRSLRALLARADLTPADLPPFAFQAEPAQRQAVVAAWRRWWEQLDKTGIPHPGPTVPLDAAFNLQPAVVEALWQQRDDRSISIGE